MSNLKLYTNKNIGEFTSIPEKLTDDFSQLDTLYLASNFDKLRTKSVAAIRKSKHYASTVNAWEKKLTGVDASDLAAVAKTLGFDVEVFNPLASSEPQTLYSGGGRYKRKAQLLKVKKGVYKPMKAGATNRETDSKRKEDWKRILTDENSTDGQIGRCLDDDEIYIDAWNEVLNEQDRRQPDTLIMRKRAINIEVIDGTAVIPDELKECELARRNSDAEEETEVEGITFPKGWPECPISYMPVGPTEQFEDEEDFGTTIFYQAREPSTGKLVCYHIDSVDRLRNGNLTWSDPHLRKPVVMFEMLRGRIKTSNLVSSKVKRHIAEVEEEEADFEDLRRGEELFSSVVLQPAELHNAVLSEDLEKVRRLIEAGADVDARQGGETPLHMSAEKGFLEITRLLIDKGADVNAVANETGRFLEEKWTPLRYSAERRHLEVARLLIDRGANVHRRDPHGITPLHASAYRGHLQLVQLMIQRGAIVDMQDNEGNTPLHICAENGHLEVARLLIDSGANIRARAFDGQTPLQIEPRLREFQRTTVRPRQGEDDDQGQDRNVRRRVGGGVRHGGIHNKADDAKLAEAIEVLFGKMKNLKMKHKVLSAVCSMKSAAPI